MDYGEQKKSIYKSLVRKHNEKYRSVAIERGVLVPLPPGFKH
jgi:hypothetical protein